MNNLFGRLGISKKEKILSATTAYEVSLEKAKESFSRNPYNSEIEWTIYNSEVVYSLKEAKDLAKKWISKEANRNNLFFVNVRIGKEYWGNSQNYFNPDSILIMSNKSEDETKEILNERDLELAFSYVKNFYTDCGKTKLW